MQSFEVLLELSLAFVVKEDEGRQLEAAALGRTFQPLFE